MAVAALGRDGSGYSRRSDSRDGTWGSLRSGQICEEPPSAPRTDRRKFSRLASRAEGVPLSPPPAPASKPTPVARPLHPECLGMAIDVLLRGGGVHQCHVVEGRDQHAHARLLRARHVDRLLRHGLDFLDLAGQAVLARADHAEGARAHAGLGAQRKPADLVPAEPLDLERVHLDRDRRELAARVVLVDGLADGLEVLRLRGAHRGRILPPRRSIGAACEANGMRPETPPRVIGALLGTELGAAFGLLVLGGVRGAPLLTTLLGALAGAASAAPVARLRERMIRRALRRQLRDSELASG